MEVTRNYYKEDTEFKWKLKQDASNSSTYLLFIDFEQAYNSINMWRLYSYIKRDIETNLLNIKLEHLDFVFYLIRKLRIQIGKQIFQPKHGVPQGGILSPILFDFAMHYYTTEAFQAYNSQIEELEGPWRIDPEDVGLWADDLAIVIEAFKKTLQPNYQSIQHFV